MRKAKVDWNSLLDPNMEKRIAPCDIAQSGYRRNEITVTYSDRTREVIWHYNPSRFEYEAKDFIGMTKLEAVFYCDQKLPAKRGDYQSQYVRGAY